MAETKTTRDLTVVLGEPTPKVVFTPAQRLRIRQQLRTAGAFDTRFPEKPLTAGERIEQERIAAARAAEQQRARETVERVERQVSEMRSESRSIASERARLQELRATIQRRQTSLVQREQPLTQRLIREFNTGIKKFNQSVGTFNSRQANLNREIISASLSAQQAGIDTTRASFVKQKFAEIGKAQEADPTAPKARVVVGEQVIPTPEGLRGIGPTRAAPRAILTTGVGITGEEVKMLPSLEQRFTAKAGRELIFERIGEEIGLQEAEKLFVARAKEDPSEFFKQLSRGVSKVHFAPVTAFESVFAGLAGFGFGKAAVPLGRELEERELLKETEKALTAFAPSLAKFRPEIETAEEFVASTRVGGELAGELTLFALPGLVKKFPKQTLVESIKRIKPKVRAPREFVKLELIEPRIQARPPKELTPKALKFVRGIEELPKPQKELTPRALKFVRGIQEPSKAAKPLTLDALRFVKGAKEPTLIKSFRQFAPKKLTAAQRRALPELGRFVSPRGVQVQQVIKPKAKVLQETVEWYKNWPPAFFEGFGKPAAAVPTAPIVAKAIKPVSKAIPGSFVALMFGLRRTKPLIKEIKRPREPFAEFRGTRRTPLEKEIAKSISGGLKFEEFLGTEAEQKEAEKRAQRQQAGFQKSMRDMQRREAKQAEAQLFQPLQIPKATQKTLQKELEVLKQPTITKTVFELPKPEVTRPKEALKEFKPLRRGFPKLPALFPFFERPVKKKKAAPGRGFDVLLKVRGQFRKQNPRPLHKSTAIALGSFLADETAAQTFKTRATRRKPTGPKKKATRLRKFRKPIRKGVPQRKSPLWIERTAFLIDRPQEKRDITAAGLRSLRASFFARKPKKRKRKRK